MFTDVSIPSKWYTKEKKADFIIIIIIKYYAIQRKYSAKLLVSRYGDSSVVRGSGYVFESGSKGIK